MHPGVVSPFAVVTLQTLATDYATWLGVDLVIDQAGEEHVLGVNFDDFHRFFYAGCPQLCQQSGRWLVGVPDSTSYCCDANQGVALTSTGFTVLVEINRSIQLKACPGDCFKPSSWTESTPFPSGSLGYFPRHSHPLTVDSAGTLHLVYHLAQGGALWYAECAAACGDSASWQRLEIDPDSASGSLVADAAIATRHGQVRVIGTTFNGGVEYLACPGGCLAAASWSSTVIDTTKAQSPSLVWGSDSVLRVAYVGTSATRFATCANRCDTAANWSAVTIAPYQSDVSLALDSANRPWLAAAGGNFNDGAVTLLHCEGDCTQSPSWVTQPVDSVTGWGWISLAMDAAGQPHMAVSGLRVQYVQLRDTTLAPSEWCATRCSH